MSGSDTMSAPETRSEAEWKATLTPEQYRVLREHGTERAGTSCLLAEKRPGTFTCAGCGTPLFVNEAKFESGTGWPSFFKPLSARNVGKTLDNSLGMARDAVSCRRCDAHLGHVFDDGPQPTGLRYCLNSVALHFVARA